MVRLIRRGVLAGALLIGAEAAYAVLKHSPMQEQFDPSASFGDPDSPPLRVAVLGDSSVTAPGVAGPDEIWISIICEKLGADRHVILRSFAVGGAMAHNLIEDQLEPAIRFEPDLVFVSVGGNDLIKGVSRGRFEENLDQVIGPLSTTGALVIQSGLGDLGTIPRLHPPLRNLVTRRSTAFDAIHWKVAEKHDATVVFQRADSSDPWMTDRDLWSEDLFHVSAAGHARWAGTIWETTMMPLLSQLGIEVDETV
jgi:lysophospholipase L1-like esterase